MVLVSVWIRDSVKFKKNLVLN